MAITVNKMALLVPLDYGTMSEQGFIIQIDYGNPGARRSAHGYTAYPPGLGFLHTIDTELPTEWYSYMILNDEGSMCNTCLENTGAIRKLSPFVFYKDEEPLLELWFRETQTVRDVGIEYQYSNTLKSATLEIFPLWDYKNIPAIYRIVYTAALSWETTESAIGYVYYKDLYFGPDGYRIESEGYIDATGLVG